MPQSLICLVAILWRSEIDIHFCDCLLPSAFNGHILHLSNKFQVGRLVNTHVKNIHPHQVAGGYNRFVLSQNMEHRAACIGFIRNFRCEKSIDSLVMNCLIAFSIIYNRAAAANRITYRREETEDWMHLSHSATGTIDHLNSCFADPADIAWRVRMD